MTVPEELLRVYLVPADEVARLNDLANEAINARAGDSNDDELTALWAVVNQMATTFRDSKIVKARFK